MTGALKVPRYYVNVLRLSDAQSLDGILTVVLYLIYIVQMGTYLGEY